MTSSARLNSLIASAAAGSEQPFSMMEACHERLQRTLGLLERLCAHVARQGADEQARRAARDVMRYFDKAAPQHHLDEEMCFEEGDGECRITGQCCLRGVLDEAVAAFYAVLDRYTPADLARNREALSAIAFVDRAPERRRGKEAT
ncbi:hypothetical protein WKW77_29760 [Variovorax ureilyticus]|uniref:Hemerythrin HHE cation binding domain-containing protein n=1 Tax=Variovorax ureilyticus TaxID=1836198 RepID=A0ABU8VNR8_9BURK